MTTYFKPKVELAHATPVAALDPERFTLADGERWYVAVTQPRKERYAAANLANQGYRYFLAQHLVTRRHARKFRTELAAVFPRYIFVVLNVQRGRWRSVNGTFGVNGLICEGDRPLAVRVGIVETLLRSSGLNGELIYQPDPLSPGDRVRLISGPFAGALGVLQSLAAAERVRLLLELVGGAITLNVPSEAVKAAY